MYVYRLTIEGIETEHTVNIDWSYWQIGNLALGKIVSIRSPPDLPPGEKYGFRARLPIS